jgi:hypothetical protein
MAPRDTTKRSNAARVETWLPKKKAFDIPTPDGVPPLHALLLYAGHRGAGKSVACVSLLRHYKKHGCMDRCFWVAPTCGSNKQYLDEINVAENDRFDNPTNAVLDQIVQEVEAEAKAWDEYLKAMKTWKRLRKADNVEQLTVQELIDADSMGLLEGEGKPKAKYGHKPVLHLVLDDCLATPIMVAGPKSRLSNLCVKHRHIGDGLGITVHLLVQSYSAHGSVGRAIRENSTAVLLWWSTQDAQRKKIAEEVSDRRGPDVFMQAYEEATQESDHDFLLVNFTKKGAERYRAGLSGPFLPTANVDASQEPEVEQELKQEPEQTQPKADRVRVVARY